jgi:folate-binding protein YgfZ
MSSTAPTTPTGALAAEYAVLVDGAGLLDESDRGKLALRGRDAKEFLQGQVSNDVLALEPGEGCYAALLTPKGKMLGDLRVLDTGAELLLDCERVALQAIFNRIRATAIGFDVELDKRTLQSSLLALIGPAARAVAGAETLPAREHSNRSIAIAGTDALVVATDVGVDLIVESGTPTESVRDELVRRGAVAVGAAAAECLRVERGRPRYGIDLDDSVIPQEAGLNERAISFTKGCYVGQETVARLHYRGKPNRALRGLRLGDPAEPGAQLTDPDGGRALGTVASSVVHPRLGPIALALVRREAPPGTLLRAEGAGDATVVELPFRAD